MNTDQIIETIQPNTEISQPIDTRDELTYPDGIYQNIFNVCFLHYINIFAGFYYENPIGGILGIMLFSSSVNYWRYPMINSSRRYIDIIIACIAVSYHIYLSFFTQNRLLCTGLLLLGISMYPFNIWLYNQQYITYSAICHCLVHIFIIMGATLTYRDYYFTAICASNNV